MNSRVILEKKDTKSFLPAAGEIRGYEGLRMLERGGVILNVISKVVSSEWVRMWCEEDMVYATISFGFEGENFYGWMAEFEEKRKLNPSEDYITIQPVFNQGVGITFGAYTILQTIVKTYMEATITICTNINNVYRYERARIGSIKDIRKTYIDGRTYGDASWWYMKNIRMEGKPFLECKLQKCANQALPDNEYAEVLLSDDKIAKRTLGEMLQEDPHCDYLEEAFNSLHIYKGADDPYKELEEMEGLEEIKENINTLAKKLRYYKNRKARGKINNASANMHMCFMGSPGTGKTTLARIMVGILYEMGMIKHNEFVEIAATDLKAQYANQTGKKTEFVIRSAYDRVLFIDEAYALASDDAKDSGREAINEILKQMEDNRDRLIVIFAGYQQDMERFLDMNMGFRSRINRYYVFRDFTPFECTQMVLSKFENAYIFTKESICALFEYFSEANNNDGFGNVRTVKMVCKKLVENWAYRTTYEGVSEDRKYVIEEEDILRI